MKCSIVTGAAGFIGSHVVDELIGMGHSVVALDDLSGGFRDNVNGNAEFVKGSITDNNLVDRLFTEHRFDYVFHLAAYAAEGLSHFIKRFNYTNNLLGSVNLINAAVNSGSVKCFVFTSSIAVYGPLAPPMRESDTPLPEDPYGIAKYAVELDLAEAQRMFGLNYIVFRPHNVYGERQNIGDPYRNVIGIFMNNALQGKAFPVFGDGLQQRAFTCVDDVAPIMAASVENPAAYNQVFNIGSDQPYAVIDLAEMVADVMGVSLDVQTLPERMEVKHAYASHEKVNRVFGDITQATPLKEGLRKMADWVKKAGSRKGESFSDIEVKRNMPPSWQSIVT